MRYVMILAAAAAIGCGKAADGEACSLDDDCESGLCDIATDATADADGVCAAATTPDDTDAKKK